MDHKRNRTQQTTEMETYECEAILKSRKREGKVQYLIKWRGYSSNMNSWEPSENLNSELLAKVQEIDDKISKEESEHSDTYRYGFERGLTAEKILGLRTEGDELQFLIKWKKSTEGEFVPAKLANEKCPQLVIKYYEEKILWKGSDDSD